MSDKSVVEQIKHYQRDIIKCPENGKRMIRCIERLMVLPVTIAHLQETGVGRSVNELRKCGGEVGAAANALVCKWKSMVQAEEDSDVESEVEDEPKETIQVSSPDIRNSPSNKNQITGDKLRNNSVNKHKNVSVDKYNKTHGCEDSKKSKSDNNSKKIESSYSDDRHKSSEQKHLDEKDQKSHRSSSSRSKHGSGSDSKHSSNHKSKSDNHFSSRSSNRSSSQQRSESECNGDMKTEKPPSKTKHDKNKLSKSTTSDVKHKSENEKFRKEESSHRSEKREDSTQSYRSSKKYDVRKIESESSDDEEVYKPRSKKRKKSESEEDRKSEKKNRRSETEDDERHSHERYSGRRKQRDHIKNQSSEESDARNYSEGEENGHTSSMSSDTHNESGNEEEVSIRSSPNDVSDDGVESNSRRSSLHDEEKENSHSEKSSDSEEGDKSPESKVYIPTKIKREKESPPRHSKTSSDKNKLSHSRSSSNHSSSHNSTSSYKSGNLNNKKEGSENIKIKKERDMLEDLKNRKEDKSSDRKIYKSSSSLSNSSVKEKKSEKRVKVEKKEDGSIDCESGASFADALMGLSEPKKKSFKRKSAPPTPEKLSKSTEKTADTKPKKLIKIEPKLMSPSSSSSSRTGFREPELLSKNIKLEPLDVDLKATLPEISPNYKPLPHYSPPSSPLGKRSKLLSQEEALSTIMSTKNQRTKVYSGNKSGYLKVPSLFDLCIQVLRDNIEALEYTGGVPYDLLKPVLDRATAAQLFQLEHYNSYLIEDTDELWKFHCNKEFRGKERDEHESWRDLYVRLLDERERKLEALKANISQSMAKNTPVRQTKLAYVDSVVKPPRNIAKKQMKFGTGKAVKHELVSKAMVGAAGSSPAPPAVPVPAPPTSARSSHSNAFPIPNFLKKKKAPLMQKTLQLIKGNRFKR